MISHLEFISYHVLFQNPLHIPLPNRSTHFQSIVNSFISVPSIKLTAETKNNSLTNSPPHSFPTAADAKTFIRYHINEPSI